jgi:hypothetical protein
MELIGNQISYDIVDPNFEKWDYWQTSDPLNTTNPSHLFMTWMNLSTGEKFTCIDNTIDANVWIGNLGTVVYGGLFDFGDMTEVDEGSALSVTSNKITASNWVNRQDQTYLYRDYGADYVDDFEVSFKVNVTSTIDQFVLPVFVMFGDIAGDFITNVSARTAVGFYAPDADGATTYIPRIWIAGSEVSMVGTLDIGTDYYFKFTRVGSTCTLSVYSDVLMASLIESVTIGNAVTYRYMMCMASYDTGKVDNKTVSLDLSDLRTSVNLVVTP